MLRRRRSHLLVFLALAAPLACPPALRRSARRRVERAGAGAPARHGLAAPPTGAAAPAAPSPPPSARRRPPLVAPTPPSAPAARRRPPARPRRRRRLAHAVERIDTRARLSSDARARQGAQRPPPTPARSARARTTSSARTGGGARARSSSSTATSARAPSCSTTSRLGRHSSSLPGQRPAVPLAAAARPELLGAERHRAAPDVSTSADRRASSTCNDETESGANMRLRLDPEIHISDNLRIVSEIDRARQRRPRVDARRVRDAAGDARRPRTATGDQDAASSLTRTSRPATTRYAPLGFFSTTQGPPPRASTASELDQRQARVGRVHDARRPAPLRPHARPVGPRHGRQRGRRHRQRLPDDPRPHHVRHRHQVDGPLLRRRLGLRLHRADERQRRTTSTAGSRTTSATSATSTSGPRSSPTSTNPEIQRLELSRTATSSSTAASTRSTARSTSTSQHGHDAAATTPQSARPTSPNNGLEPRQAWAFTPDLWVQALWRKLRFEAEAAMI